MNLTKLEKINGTADSYRDAKMALENLPPDDVVLAYLMNNPEDMRIGVRTPPGPEQLKKLMDENPDVPEEMVERVFCAHISVDIAPEDRPKMLTLMRVLLQARVERLAAELRELGVDPESAVDASAESGSAIH